MKRDEQACTAGRIARRMGVSRSLMSKAVDHLVRGGWIETKPDQSDEQHPIC